MEGEGAPPARGAGCHSVGNPARNPNPDREPLAARIEFAYRRFLRCHPGRITARASASR